MIQELTIIEGIIGWARALNDKAAENGAERLPASPLFFVYAECAKVQLSYARRFEGRSPAQDFAMDAATSIQRAKRCLA